MSCCVLSWRQSEMNAGRLPAAAPTDRLAAAAGEIPREVRTGGQDHLELAGLQQRSLEVGTVKGRLRLQSPAFEQESHSCSQLSEPGATSGTVEVLNQYLSWKSSRASGTCCRTRGTVVAELDRALGHGLGAFGDDRVRALAGWACTDTKGTLDGGSSRRGGSSGSDSGRQLLDRERSAASCTSPGRTQTTSRRPSRRPAAAA